MPYLLLLLLVPTYLMTMESDQEPLISRRLKELQTLSKSTTGAHKKAAMMLALKEIDTKLCEKKYLDELEVIREEAYKQCTGYYYYNDMVNSLLWSEDFYRGDSLNRAKEQLKLLMDYFPDQIKEEHLQKYPIPGLPVKCSGMPRHFYSVRFESARERRKQTEDLHELVKKHGALVTQRKCPCKKETDAPQTYVALLPRELKDALYEYRRAQWLEAWRHSKLHVPF